MSRIVGCCWRQPAWYDKLEKQTFDVNSNFEWWRKYMHMQYGHSGWTHITSMQSLSNTPLIKLPYRSSRELAHGHVPVWQWRQPPPTTTTTTYWSFLLLHLRVAGQTVHWERKVCEVCREGGVELGEMGKVRGLRSGEKGRYSQVGLPGLEWSDAYICIWLRHLQE